jgi:UDP-3-O-[3-hydroxymyristoyl] N-acetylglucosamine deacetylase
MHTAFVARLLKDRSAWELAHIPANETASEARSEEALGTPVLAGA